MTAYYQPELPPPSIWMDACYVVEWIVLKLSLPLMVITLPILFLVSAAGARNRFHRYLGIPLGVFGTLGIMAIVASFVLYWGLIALLIYEGLKKLRSVLS